MARISGADPNKQGLLSGLLTRIVYGMTKRKLGRLVMPVRIAAHHSKILWGYGQIHRGATALCRCGERQRRRHNTLTPVRVLGHQSASHRPETAFPNRTPREHWFRDMAEI